MSRKQWAAAVLALCALAAAAFVASALGGGRDDGSKAAKNLADVEAPRRHLRGEPQLRQPVRRLGGRERPRRTRRRQDAQVDQNGLTYGCLLQNDVNLTSPPLTPVCKGPTRPARRSRAHFTNAPFAIDDYIPPTDTTCPTPGVFADERRAEGHRGCPGGCTRDIVHRFYQEQYQLDGGKQDRYVTGSDAVGLDDGTLRHEGAADLPVPARAEAPALRDPRQLLPGRVRRLVPEPPVADRRARAALVDAERRPTRDLHSIARRRTGLPNRATRSTSRSPSATVQGRAADAGVRPADDGAAGLACGNYAVNTIAAVVAAVPRDGGAVLPPQTGKNIGDELNAKGSTGPGTRAAGRTPTAIIGGPGWTNGTGPTCSDPNATPNPAYPYCPDEDFQFHHQPFNYFADFDRRRRPARRPHGAPEGRGGVLHVAPAAKRTCGLKPVSFIKPVGSENEHPGYASEAIGCDHLSSCSRRSRTAPCAKDTIVIVTYDEFGGQWDHVSPPERRRTRSARTTSSGPGTRIPALVLAPDLQDDEFASTRPSTTRRRSSRRSSTATGSRRSRSRDAQRERPLDRLERRPRSSRRSSTTATTDAAARTQYRQARGPAFAPGLSAFQATLACRPLRRGRCRGSRRARRGRAGRRSSRRRSG